MDNDSFLLENTGRSIVFNDEENTKNESSTPNDLIIRAELFDAIWNCSEEDDNEYFKNLNMYITAGEEKLAELENEVLPRLKEEAIQANDSMSA